MHSRSYRYLAALAVAPLAAGCMQMTRHSNTMVFGTSTSVALKVGQNANQVPEVLIGYDRQEAVIMPLLANTRERDGEQYLLSPCEPLAERQTEYRGGRTVVTETMQRGDVTGTDAEAMIHPCKFVGMRTGDDGELMIQDSYSVLASFGANIQGDAAATKGSVGLAQYFATGVAAQILAATGGAAVVAVGQAAEESARSPTKAAAAASIVGEVVTPADAGPTFDAAWGKLLLDVGATDDAVERVGKVRAATARAGVLPGASGRIATACNTSKDACVSELNSASALFNTPGFVSPH